MSRLVSLLSLPWVLLLGAQPLAAERTAMDRILLVPDASAAILPLSVSGGRAATQTVRHAPRYGYVENRGQWDERARFVARRGASTLFVTERGLWLRVVRRSEPGHLTPADCGTIEGVVDYQVVLGGGGPVSVEPLDELPGRNNFFVGDENRWRTRVPSYSRLRLVGGGCCVDLVEGDDGLALEFATGTRGSYAGVSCERWEDGAVEVIALGDLAPQISQFSGAATLSPVAAATSGMVPAGSKLAASGALGVTLDYSSYLGGSSGELAFGVAADGSQVIVVGETGSFDFPLTPGVMDPAMTIEGDAFVTKLVADGTSFVFSTYLGGAASDTAWAVAPCIDGSIFVAGYFNGFNGSSFPTTPGAFDQTPNGGIFDGFVARISAAGDQLLYSTILGGSDDDFLSVDIQVDAEANAYVAGTTQSPDFPTTPGCYQPGIMSLVGENTFVTKVNPSGTALVYSTYFGGTARAETWGISLGASDAAYLTGRVSTSTPGAIFPATPGAYDVTPNGNWDVFVAKLLPDGSDVVYATFIGASNEDDGRAVAVDAAGAAYVSGWTYSDNFPTTPGAIHSLGTGGANEDVFVCKLDPTGSVLEYSALVGHSQLDRAYDIAVSAAGEAWVTGQTASAGFPTTPDAFDPTANLGDAFVLGLTADGSELLYSTFLGGNSSLQELAFGIDIDEAGGVCIAGTTTSTDFPLTPGVADPTFAPFDEAFVARFRALWPNLGGASAGIAGQPRLSGRGALVGGSPTAIQLSNAPADTLYLAWLSFAPRPWQVLGGTLYAYPFGLQLLFATDAGGSGTLEFPWPAGIAPGLTFYLQDVVLDVSVPAQLTLSNAVTATTL